MVRVADPTCSHDLLGGLAQFRALALLRDVAGGVDNLAKVGAVGVADHVYDVAVAHGGDHAGDVAAVRVMSLSSRKPPLI